MNLRALLHPELLIVVTLYLGLIAVALTRAARWALARLRRARPGRAGGGPR